MKFAEIFKNVLEFLCLRPGNVQIREKDFEAPRPFERMLRNSLKQLFLRRGSQVGSARFCSFKWPEEHPSSARKEIWMKKNSISRIATCLHQVSQPDVSAGNVCELVYHRKSAFLYEIRKICGGTSKSFSIVEMARFLSYPENLPHLNSS